VYILHCDPERRPLYYTATTWHLLHVQISPEPHCETLAPFSNLRSLRLDARLGWSDKFFQVEAMAAQAIKTCGTLTRVEVTPTMYKECELGIMCRSVFPQCEASNQWIRTMNRGTGVKAKTVHVTAWIYCLGTMGPDTWFWECAEGERLTWKGRLEKPHGAES
jgi:hypothetical protein